jgi:fucose permease
VFIIVLPVSVYAKGIALFFIGLGNGPTFPNLTHNTPHVFGKEISQSIVGTQMVACNIGICIMPPIFGLLAEWICLSFFPVFIGIMFLLMSVGTIVYDKLPSKVFGYTKTE